MILNGYKTYIGVILATIGVACEQIEGLPEEIAAPLQVVGLIIAAIGRKLAKVE